MIAIFNAIVVAAQTSGGTTGGLHDAVAFVVLAVMLAMVGEYVGGLSRRMRDRPSYYVREEHTSSVLLKEDRRNVVTG